MTVTVQFSNSYRAKMARIKRLPELADEIMMSQLKRNATELIEEFQKGIRSNNFGLRKLQQSTITRKVKKYLTLSICFSIMLMQNS